MKHSHQNPKKFLSKKIKYFKEKCEISVLALECFNYDLDQQDLEMNIWNREVDSLTAKNFIREHNAIEAVERGSLKACHVHGIRILALNTITPSETLTRVAIMNMESIKILRKELKLKDRYLAFVGEFHACTINFKNEKGTLNKTFVGLGPLLRKPTLLASEYGSPLSNFMFQKKDVETKKTPHNSIQSGCRLGYGA